MSTEIILQLKAENAQLRARLLEAEQRAEAMRTAARIEPCRLIYATYREIGDAIAAATGRGERDVMVARLISDARGLGPHGLMAQGDEAKISSIHFDGAKAFLASERSGVFIASSEGSAAWPSGCIKPNSCARNRQCQYGQVPACRHLGKDLTQAVEAAAREREWNAAEQQKGGGSAA